MSKKHARDTRLAHAGRNPAGFNGAVNVPVFHASTLLFPTVDAMEEANKRPFDSYTYGRTLTPTIDAFERTVAEIEGGHRAVAVSSGLAAVSVALMAHVRAGDHVLMVDSTYGPTRRLCDTILKQFGVETTYYDPLIGAGIADLCQPNTAVIFLESPGSHTFEVQDVPAIVTVARDRGIVTMIDNTWASPWFYRPLEHGVDVSIHAATKYIVGHSDAMMGVVILGDEARFQQVKRTASYLGHHAAPDDVYLALRGLRTLSVRMPRHQANATAVATWLAERPEVERVLYPALPSDPGYDLWRRDFDGASGLLGVVLKPVSDTAVRAMVDGMTLFGLGASWGGYESLILPTQVKRTATTLADSAMIRLHIGLEDPEDLIADLAAGFDRLNAA